MFNVKMKRMHSYMICIWHCLPVNMQLFLLVVFLHDGLIHGVAGKYTLEECDGAGYIDIVFNKTTYVTCTGLDPNRTVVWGINMDTMNNSQLLGRCAPCQHAPCAKCSVGNYGYPITRQPFKTTIDLTISETNDTFSLICESVEEHPRSANCTVNVIEMLPIDTAKRDHSLSTIAAVRVGVGVAAVVLFAVLVALIVVLKRTDSTFNDNITTHGAKVKTKQNNMYADNPAHNKEPDTLRSVQLADVLSTSQTDCSANRTEVPSDTDAYTYIEVDLEEAEEKKISQTAGANARRVLFFKHAPADKTAPCRELEGSADEDYCNNAEIASKELSNTCLESQRAETAADAYGYSHITISSNSTREQPHESENGRLQKQDKCVSSPNNNYDHITISSEEKQMQEGKFRQQDDCCDPMATKEPDGKNTETAARADDYNHIDINSEVREVRSQTSANKASVPDVDPCDRIQNTRLNEETKLENEILLDETTEHHADEYSTLKFARWDNNTDDSKCSHVSQV